MAGCVDAISFYLLRSGAKPYDCKCQNRQFIVRPSSFYLWRTQYVKKLKGTYYTNVLGCGSIVTGCGSIGKIYYIRVRYSSCRLRRKVIIVRKVVKQTFLRIEQS